MAATITGRLAMPKPDMQNVPVRTEEGRLIRTAFIGSAGKHLVSGDYSQIEWRARLFAGRTSEQPNANRK